MFIVLFITLEVGRQVWTSLSLGSSTTGVEGQSTAPVDDILPHDNESEVDDDGDDDDDNDEGEEDEEDCMYK